MRAGATFSFSTENFVNRTDSPHPGFSLTDDPGALQWPAVHALLGATYWAAKRRPQRTEEAARQSLCFSILHEGRQVGFARALTDEGVYAVILDVVIAPEFQGRGLGKWLLRSMLEHPRLKGLRVVLWTTDQVEFYRACGFKHEEAFQLLGTTPAWG